MRYKIVYGYTRTGREKVRRFRSLAGARRVAEKIFVATGIVVAIERGKKA